jgi:DNA-directed RNA polymerase sigma subunit (sigma70/sigma32)
MRSSIILPTSRQRSTGSIERGSANHLEASIEKSGSRAVRMMRRESLGFQHEQNDVALSSYSRELGVSRERVRQLEAAALKKLLRAFKEHLGPIEAELLATA